jgi:ubiquinone/menaquinone biosynthesis C-methylase UbiE
MDNKKTVKKGYNTIAAKYCKIRHEDSEDVLLLQELVTRLPGKAKVLDAGCGAGVPITKFLSQLFEVTGVDFAETQIQLARQRVPEAQFLCQDMTKLEFPDCYFDAICSYYAIIHIPREEHEPLLLNFNRMLKPGGFILLCMGADDLKDDIADYHGISMYWSHYNADTNIEMVKKCGFTIIWSKIVKDSTHPESGHLFVLAQKI